MGLAQCIEGKVNPYPPQKGCFLLLPIVFFMYLLRVLDWKNLNVLWVKFSKWHNLEIYFKIIYNLEYIFNYKYILDYVI